MNRLLPVVVIALCFLRCVDAAACPPDKATPFTGTDPSCDCGTTPEKCTANQYCDSTAAGKCSKDPFCPDDKTAQIFVAPCTCKDKTCQLDEYCDVTGTGKCIKACPTDKTIKARDECGCRSKTCAKDDYCDIAGDAGKGSCDKSPPPTVKSCPTDKAAKITDATCACSSQTCKNGQYCDSTGGGTCSDNPPTPALPTCPAPPNPTLVDCQCLSATCKRGDKCTNGMCSQEQDLDQNCFRYGGLCNNTVSYKEQMQKNCAATCARLSGFLPPAPCFDRNANCPTWPNFCRNSYYTYELKKYYCQRTCNMC